MNDGFCLENPPIWHLRFWRHFWCGWIYPWILLSPKITLLLPQKTWQFRLDAKDGDLVKLLKHQMLHWSCTTSLEASSIVWATWLQDIFGQRNDVNMRYNIWLYLKLFAVCTNSDASSCYWSEICSAYFFPELILWCHWGTLGIQVTSPLCLEGVTSHWN